MARMSRFQPVPMNVAGGSNQTRSRAVSIARMANWYPAATPTGVSEAVLMPFPGLTVVGDATATESNYRDRGAYVFNSVTYFVKGTYLYSMASDYSVTQIGAVYGFAVCSFADNGAVMVIATGGPVYQYDGATLSILTDILFNPSVVTYLNNKFIFNSDTDRFWHTNPGTTFIDGANNAIAESNPDPFVLPYVFNQILYLFGSASIEPWQDVGSGNPSFERENQAIIEKIGCSSVHGVANSSNYMYFIDRSAVAYRIRSFQADPISTDGVALQFQKYDLTRYRAQHLRFDNQDFIKFDFYADNKTWVFAETTGTWFELDSGLEGDRWNGGSYVFSYNQHFFFDNILRWVYKMDFAGFLNNGTQVVREKTFDFVAGERLGRIRGLFELSHIDFGIEAGSGLLEGQGEVPLIGVQVTIDGKTWSQEEFIEIGRSGEFSKQISFYHMAQFAQMTIRVRLYDPVGFAFFSAVAYVREAGV